MRGICAPDIRSASRRRAPTRRRASALVGPSFSRIYDVEIGPYEKFKHVIEPRVDYNYVSPVGDPTRTTKPSSSSDRARSKPSVTSGPVFIDVQKQGPARDCALDRDDQVVAPPRGVVMVDDRSALEDAILDAQRGDLARADAQERFRREVPRRVLSAAGAVGQSVAVRPDRLSHARRESPALP